MEEQIIIKQVKPTPWVSSAIYPWKLNGDGRVCLDPGNLNDQTIRENHKPMTVENLAYEMAGTTV